MIRFFLNLFAVPPARGKRNGRRASATKRLVMRYARGNVRLKEGRYMTQDDAERKKRKAFGS